MCTQVSFAAPSARRGARGGGEAAAPAPPLDESRCRLYVQQRGGGGYDDLSRALPVPPPTATMTDVVLSALDRATFALKAEGVDVGGTVRQAIAFRDALPVAVFDEAEDSAPHAEGPAGSRHRSPCTSDCQCTPLRSC